MKKIFIVLFWAFGLSVAAQEIAPKTFFWGVVTGIEQHRLSVQSIPLKVMTPESPLAGSERTGTPGALLGAFVRWQLTRDLAIQPELLFSYAQNKVRFYPENILGRYRFMDVEIPLHFVVTNARKQLPLRASFLFGGRIGWNFAANTSDKLALLRERMAADIGLGAEIRLRKYRIQPEIVYSYGLNNLHDYRNTLFDPGISNVVRDRITIRVLVWR
ncbi:MAG: outer membrane beta-barrel protein [Saprospiraceae bacterium]|nr:outer membrane beta-barrel protein [Saprospiraceae bacterium]